MTLLLKSWKDSLIQAVQQTTDAVMFARAWLNWEPHDGQRRWLMAPERNTAVLVTGRRWGKDEAEAVKTLYHAVFRPKSKQLFASVTLDQARIPWDRCVQFISEQPLLEALLKAPPKESPFPLLRFRHGSIITARSTAREGVYIRGHDFDRVVLTEADYLSEKMITEAVRFTLADRAGGQLTLQTTPKPLRGFVYRELQRGLVGDPNVYAQTGSTFENPHIDHDYIRSLRDRMTTSAWQREVEGMYTDDVTTVFGWQHVQAAYEEADWSLPVPPDPQRRYVCGADLAKTEDWTVITVLDATQKPYKLVHWERFQRLPWPAVAARIREIHYRYNCHQTLLDSTGVGDAVLDEVRDIAQGYVFTHRSKLDLLTSLQLALEKREVQFPFVRELVDELQGYSWDDKALVTDCVMSLALAVWAAGPRATVQWAPSIWG